MSDDILPWHLSNQEDLETRIIRHEGFCSTPKIDVAPMYVIGFGHDITKDECANYPNGITWDDAEKLLQDDIVKVKKGCAKSFPWISGLSLIRQDVIYEMCFQIGIAGVEKFHGMIAAIKNQNWDSAVQHMLGSLWHKETPKRCEELANLMLKG